MIRYLLGTIDKGIFFHKDSPLTLHAFSDADWAGNRDDRTSTSAHIIFLGKNPVAWSSKISVLLFARRQRMNIARLHLQLLNFVG